MLPLLKLLEKVSKWVWLTDSWPKSVACCLCQYWFIGEGPQNEQIFDHLLNWVLFTLKIGGRLMLSTPLYTTHQIKPVNLLQRHFVSETIHSAAEAGSASGHCWHKFKLCSRSSLFFATCFGSQGFTNIHWMHKKKMQSKEFQF